MGPIFDTDRRTELWCDLPATVLGRRSHTLQRHARDIRQQRQVYAFFGGLFNAGKVLKMGSDAWIIQPFGRNPIELVESANVEWVDLGAVNAVPSLSSYNTYRKPTGTGMGASGSLLSTGAPAFQKRRAAGSSWNDELTADAAALPKIALPLAPMLPVDRVLSGHTTYPANTPFLLRLWITDGQAEESVRFYFGGNAECLPSTEQGGQVALSLQASGQALLYERTTEDPDAFGKPIHEFIWKHIGGGSADTFAVYLIPYGRDRLGFLNLPTGSQFAGKTTLEAMPGVASAGAAVLHQPANLHVFRHNSARDDHRHLTSMTGPGTIRADRRRNDRTPFSIVRLKYRPEAYLIDALFFVEANLPALTPMVVTPDTFTPEGTSIEVQMYDAAGNELTAQGNAFLSLPGSNRYFVKFTFHSDVDEDHIGEQTPVLFGYTVSIPPAYTSVAATPTKIDCIKSLTVTGPGISSTEENAAVALQDLTDEAAILRVRDGMRSKVVVVNRATGSPISVLFEGQTASPSATKRGLPGEVYPDADWHDYAGTLTGLWPRLMEQIHRGPPVSFTNSIDSPHPKASVVSATGWEPWCITDILRWAANRAGVPDSELDIPHSSLRLWPSPNLSMDDYAIMPGVPYGKFIETLPKDFLGQIWMRDPNAGLIDSTGLPTGMWRLIPNAFPTSTNFLLTISLDVPPVSGRMPMAEGAYGAGVWPIREGTWDTFPKAAEGNVVLVYGLSAGDSDSGPQLLTSYPLVNLDSYDSSSPHYLEGRTIPITRGVDPFLSTQEAVDWVARVIYKRACFAEKWFKAVIPLALVTDPLDTKQVLPRPLRINDLIRIKSGGVLYPAIVRSANPSYDHDDLQWVMVEGRFR